MDGLIAEIPEDIRKAVSRIKYMEGVHSVVEYRFALRRLYDSSSDCDLLLNNDYRKVALWAIDILKPQGDSKDG